MIFTKKQIDTLEEVMDRLGEVVKAARFDQPLAVGIAKAYALTALAYAEATPA